MVLIRYEYNVPGATQSQTESQNRSKGTVYDELAEVRPDPHTGCQPGKASTPHGKGDS